MLRRIKSCRITITLKRAGLRLQRSLITAFWQNGRLAITRHVTFPTLRKLPNDTYGSLSHNFTQEQSAAIVSDGKKAELKVQSVEINGMIAITLAAENLRVVRTLCPGASTAFIERYEITNTGEQTQSIEFSAPYYLGETDSSKGYRKQCYETFSAWLIKMESMIKA